MPETTVKPIVELAHRPLNFFWMVDCSTSMMKDGKIETVNCAISNCLPDMRTVANQNPNAQMMIHALKFATGAEWLTTDPVPVENYNWNYMEAGGLTDLGVGLEKLADQLDESKIGERALPPVVVLLSDGMPTDDYKSGIKKVQAKPWWHKTVRIAIAIGKNADLKVLEEFTGNIELVLQADNATQLTKLIRWASTRVPDAVTNTATKPVQEDVPKPIDPIITILPSPDPTPISEQVW